MIEREWIQIEGRMPDSNRIVRVRGVMTADAMWEIEKNSWTLADQINMECNVVDWKEKPLDIAPIVVPPPIEPEVLPAE
jgi:hypothetical protein